MLIGFPPAGINKGWPWIEETPASLYDPGIQWPKISIVTPSFNQGEYIEETLRSIILQNYPNLEYLVIDGGSTDQTVPILQTYAPWLFYWVSEKDEGQADAINKGFERASGEIMAYLNSDDLYLPGTLHKVASLFLKKGNNRLLLSGELQIFPGQKTMRAIPDFTVKDWIRKIDYTLPQPSTFWSNHNSFTRMDSQFHFVFDRLFFIDLREKGYTLTVIPEKLAAFRIHNSSKTISRREYFYEENKKVNIEKAVGYGRMFVFEIKRRHLYFELKTRFYNTRKIDRFSLRFLLSFAGKFPIILIRKWFWAWFKFIFTNTLLPKKANLK